MALAERQTGGTLSGPMPRRTPYTQPSDISATTLKELLADRGAVVWTSGNSIFCANLAAKAVGMTFAFSLPARQNGGN